MSVGFAGSAFCRRAGKPLKTQTGVCGGRRVSATQLARTNEGETMKPAIFKKIFVALLLLVCLSGVTMAQSVLSDDAYTSTDTISRLGIH